MDKRGKINIIAIQVITDIIIMFLFAVSFSKATFHNDHGMFNILGTYIMAQIVFNILAAMYSNDSKGKAVFKSILIGIMIFCLGLLLLPCFL